MQPAKNIISNLFKIHKDFSIVSKLLIKPKPAATDDALTTDAERESIKKFCNFISNFAQVIDTEKLFCYNGEVEIKDAPLAQLVRATGS